MPHLAASALLGIHPTEVGIRVHQKPTEYSVRSCTIRNCPKLEAGQVPISKRMGKLRYRHYMEYFAAIKKGMNRPYMEQHRQISQVE